MIYNEKELDAKLSHVGVMVSFGLSSWSHTIYIYIYIYKDNMN